jgi:hypothetical protein
VYPSLEKGQAWLNIYPEYLLSKNSSKYRAKVKIEITSRLNTPSISRTVSV